MVYEHMYINIFHKRKYNATTLLSVVQPVGLGLKSRQSRLHNSAALAFLGLWSGIPVHRQIIFHWLWDLGSGLWDLSSSPVAVAAMNWSHNQSCHFYGWGKGGDSATSFYGGKSLLFQVNINCIPDQSYLYLCFWLHGVCISDCSQVDLGSRCAELDFGGGRVKLAPPPPVFVAS